MRASIKARQWETGQRFAGVFSEPAIVEADDGLDRGRLARMETGSGPAAERDRSGEYPSSI